jgi:PAS domain S-box-containing protein
VKKVLLIEDSVELAAHWQAAFEAHDLYVIHEPEYEKAIELLRETDFDLVVTDITLPNEKGKLFDFAGLAIISYIVLELKNPPKVIAVSGSNFEQTNLPFLHLLDCAKLLQKPFAAKKIVELGIKLIGEKSLEERLEKMKAVEARYATDSVFWLNHQGGIVDASEAAVKDYQYTHEQLMEMTIDRIDSELKSLDQFTDKIWPLIKRNGRKTFTMTHRRKDGSTFPVEIAAHFVEFEGEEAICSFVRDITQRRADEEELRLLGAAVKASQDAFVITKAAANDGEEASVVFANEAYTKITGFSFEETLGKQPRLMEGADTNQDVFIAITDALANFRPIRTEILLYEKSGTAFWCEFQLTPVADSQGNNTHCLMVFRDITKRKLADETLFEVSSSHRAMVELLGSTDGVWDWNIETGKVIFQAGYRLVLGYDGDDVDGLPNHFDTFESNIHPEDRQRVFSIQQESIKAKTSFEAEYRMRCKDGSYIWVHDRGATIYGKDDQPTRMTGSIYDITLRRETQVALISERELLRRSNSDLEQFAYVASHDLQEPLRAVGGFMQLLDQQYSDKLDEKASGYVRKAVAGATRMEQLINDLLHFSRVTREGKSLTRVDLNDVVTSACLSLEEVIGRRGAEIDVGRLPTIQGDLSQLSQLFQNLIDNAIKYCQADTPRVAIQSSEEQGNWQVSVSDNGIGIDPEYRDQIFAIFNRLHRREQYPGTGIGLAICRRVVQRHGGSISVQDKVDQSGGQTGCRFVLKFPKIKPD